MRVSGFKLRQTPSRGSPQCHPVSRGSFSSSATSSYNGPQCGRPGSWYSESPISMCLTSKPAPLPLPCRGTLEPKTIFLCWEVTDPKQSGEHLCLRRSNHYRALRDRKWGGGGDNLLIVNNLEECWPEKTRQRARCQRVTAWASSHSSRGLQGSCFMEDPTGAGKGGCGGVRWS